MSFVRELFAVLYSPLKAFEEIVKKPNVKGPLLVLVLVLFAAAVAQYVNTSKIFVETATPDTDNWTESTSHWASNGVVSNDTDCIVGNYSVKSFVSNRTYIWMKRANIGQFNCSEDANYEALSFRIKWIHQDDTFPANATLRLFDAESRYIELNIINLVNSSDTWANITVNVGLKSHNWSSVNFNWENVTGLEFELAWLPSKAANLTMKIDDMYFGKYVSFLNTDFYNSWFISSLIGYGSALTDTIVGWALYAVFLWLIFKVFHVETGPLSTLFIVIGYTFFVRVIFLLVSSLLTSTLPPLNFPLKAWKPVAGEEQIASESINNIYQTYWAPTLAYTISYFLPFVFYAWIVALCTVAIRFLRGLTWGKAVAISSIAYAMSLFMRPLIPI